MLIFLLFFVYAIVGMQVSNNPHYMTYSPLSEILFYFRKFINFFILF